MSDLDEGFRELQAEYLAEVPKRLTELGEDLVAIGAGDLEAPDALARKFHQLAGSGGSYGFPEISLVAREAEQFIRRNPPWNADNIKRLDEALERLAAVVAQATGSSEEPSTALARDLGFRGHVVGRPGELRDAIADILANAGLHLTTDAGSVEDLSQARDLPPSQWPEVMVIIDHGDDGDIDPVLIAAAWSAARAVRPQVLVLIQGSSERAGPSGTVPGVDAIFSPEQARSELPVYITTAMRTGSPPIRVLLIEDDLDQAQLMTGWLETVGIQVVHARAPALARPLLRGASLDMVVLDVTLADGLAFAREAEQHQPRAHLPVLLLAGQADIAQHLEALRATGYTFLTKPIADKQGPFLNWVITRADRGRQLRQTVYRDSLTGLLNHTTLMVALEHAIAQARRRGSDTALLTIGIHDLEEVNARHGHLIGDQVLGHAAKVLRAATRGAHLLGRLSGTTLGVIALSERGDNAGVLARQIQAAFEAHPLDRPGAESIRISASIGIACFPGTADSGPAIVAAAEHARARAPAGGVETAPSAT